MSIQRGLRLACMHFSMPYWRHGRRHVAVHPSWRLLRQRQWCMARVKWHLKGL